jgi:adenylate cyclase
MAFERSDPRYGAGPIISWLVEHGGARVEAKTLITELCERLVVAGVSLSRVSYGVPTLHPQLRGRQLIWRRERGASETSYRRGVEQSSDYLDSPFRALHEGAATVRRRLDGATTQLDFPILHDLRRAGATDYLAMPLRFSSGRMGYLSWATDRPGGFSAAEEATLRALMPPLALRLELEASYEMSESLLKTYLGRDAAQRVLAGEVERGRGKHIRAAVLLSDMRGFTAMSDRSSPDDVVAVLNDYFDVIVTEVEKHHGEVLKFIGDGMLAVFDVDGSRYGTACCQAVHAAIGAVRALAVLNRRRAEPLRVGIALHLDDVLYGNIGAAERLDFTVIGAAVNEAARIEALCRSLDRQILTSASFAGSCTCKPLRSLGLHRLPGVREPQELFTVDGLDAN